MVHISTYGECIEIDYFDLWTTVLPKPYVEKSRSFFEGLDAEAPKQPMEGDFRSHQSQVEHTSSASVPDHHIVHNSQLHRTNEQGPFRKL